MTAINFGHLEVLGKLQVHSSGLSVCYSARISGATLKILLVVSYFKHTTNAFLNDGHF